MSKAIPFKLDDLTDEEMDRYYEPVTANMQKSLVGNYLYAIIKNRTGNGKVLRQADIVRILRDEYDITIDRKAVGRTLNALKFSSFGIMYTPEIGAWYDENEDLAA